MDGWQWGLALSLLGIGGALMWAANNVTKELFYQLKGINDTLREIRDELRTGVKPKLF
jgi:hypothetical protein